MKDLDDASKNEVKDALEAALPGSGEAVLGDQAEFEMAETDWSPEDKAAFCSALCPKFFEVNDSDDETQ